MYWLFRLYHRYTPDVVCARLSLCPRLSDGHSPECRLFPNYRSVSETTLFLSLLNIYIQVFVQWAYEIVSLIVRQNPNVSCVTLKHRAHCSYYSGAPRLLLLRDPRTLITQGLLALSHLVRNTVCCTTPECCFGIVMFSLIIMVSKYVSEQTISIGGVFWM